MDEKTRQAGGDHYMRMPIQPWDVVDTWPIEEQVGFYRGNILKYLFRLHDKESAIVQCEKLIHYAQKLLAVLKSA